MSKRRQNCVQNHAYSCCYNCVGWARSITHASRGLSNLWLDLVSLASARALACTASTLDVGDHSPYVACLECSYPHYDLGRGRGANGNLLPWPCIEECAIASSMKSLTKSAVLRGDAMVSSDYIF